VQVKNNGSPGWDYCVEDFLRRKELPRGRRSKEPKKKKKKKTETPAKMIGPQ